MTVKICRRESFLQLETNSPHVFHAIIFSEKDNSQKQAPKCLWSASDVTRIHTIKKNPTNQNTKTNPTTVCSNCSSWSEGEKGLRRKEKKKEKKLNQSTIKWLTGPAAVPQWKILLLLDLQTPYSWKPTYLIPINTSSQSEYTNQINDWFSLPQAEHTLWQ